MPAICIGTWHVPKRARLVFDAGWVQQPQCLCTATCPLVPRKETLDVSEASSGISPDGEVSVSVAVLVLYAPFSALPPKVGDTGREHHFSANKDVACKVVIPLCWHAGCWDWPAMFSVSLWNV